MSPGLRVAADLGLTPGKGQGQPDSGDPDSGGGGGSHRALPAPQIAPPSVPTVLALPTPRSPRRDSDSWAWVPGPLHSTGRSVQTPSPALQRAAWRHEDDNPPADTVPPQVTALYFPGAPETPPAGTAPHTPLYHGDSSGLGRPLPNDQRKGLPGGWVLHEQRLERLQGKVVQGQWTPPCAGPRALEADAARTLATGHPAGHTGPSLSPRKRLSLSPGLSKLGQRTRSPFSAAAAAGTFLQTAQPEPSCPSAQPC